MGLSGVEIDLIMRLKDQVSRKLDTIRGKAGQFGKLLAAGAAVGAIAIAGIGVAATSMAADFEKSMAEVRTLLPQISEQGFGQLQDDVLEFSKLTGIATKEAVPALYQAISAGVPKENVMTFMEIASKAAIGGVTDLETAVDGITSVVNAYGSDVIDAAEASDIMFTAVKLGKTDFDSLSRSLFNVIPTAASLGISFEEVAASLALLTAQGTPTAVATTQLRSLFVEATTAGNDLSTAIEDLTGQSLTQLIATGAEVDAIMGAVRDSMSDDEFRNLFGSVEALNAALGITGPNAEAMSRNLVEMQNAAGSLDAAFETVAETFDFKLQKAINQGRVLLTKLGLVILPLVTDALETKLMPALEDFGDWFDDNEEAIEAAIIGVGNAAAHMFHLFSVGLSTVGPPLIAFGSWIIDNKVAMVAAITAVGVAIVFALGPVSATAAAIAGIILAIGFLKENWQDLALVGARSFRSLVQFIGKGVDLMIDKIGDLIEFALKPLVKAWNAVAGVVPGLGTISLPGQIFEGGAGFAETPGLDALVESIEESIEVRDRERFNIEAGKKALTGYDVELEASAIALAAATAATEADTAATDAAAASANAAALATADAGAGLDTVTSGAKDAERALEEMAREIARVREEAIESIGRFGAVAGGEAADPLRQVGTALLQGAQVNLTAASEQFAALQALVDAGILSVTGDVSATGDVQRFIFQMIAGQSAALSDAIFGLALPPHLQVDPPLGLGAAGVGAGGTAITVSLTVEGQVVSQEDVNEAIIAAVIEAIAAGEITLAAAEPT